MIVLGQAEGSVAAKLPPSSGLFAGYDWQSFYNAILHVMQHPANQAAYYTAYRAIEALPPGMKLKPEILVAAWARFTELYPGWKYWDYRAAYDLMLLFMTQTGRMIEGDGRQWWTVEQAWQEMEKPDIVFVRAPSMAGIW